MYAAMLSTFKVWTHKNTYFQFEYILVKTWYIFCIQFVLKYYYYCIIFFVAMDNFGWMNIKTKY